ncbi:hypothetical protein N7499_012969 [Penicillium canescens]|nr:hypothetical protein N7499_012969 [Penicillium canescens]
MAPNLPSSTRESIHDMLLGKSLTTAHITDATECSPRSITTIRNNLWQRGDTTALSIQAGRLRMTPLILEAPCDYVLGKPGLFLEEMAIFLSDE